MHLQNKCRSPSLDDIYNVGIFDLKLKILAEGESGNKLFSSGRWV